MKKDTIEKISIELSKKYNKRYIFIFKLIEEGRNLGFSINEIKKSIIEFLN